MRTGRSAFSRFKDHFARLWMRQRVREYVVLLIIVITASLAIVYSNVQTYDPVQAPKTGYGDSLTYLAMYHGEPGSVASTLNCRVKPR